MVSFLLKKSRKVKTMRDFDFVNKKSINVLHLLFYQNLFLELLE